MPFDINAFLRRTNMTQREFADKAGFTAGIVGAWASGRITPSYEKCEVLFRCGMNLEEMFGKEISEIVTRQARKDITEDESEKIVREGLARILAVM